MPKSTTREERAERALYLRDRHKVVLTTVIIALVIAVAIAIPLAMGWIGSPKKDASGSQANNYGVQTTCLVPGKETALNMSDIHLRVLNGTTHAGLATAVAQEFTNRGFGVQGVGDWESKTTTRNSIIYFGRNAIQEAYTLRAQFPNDVVLRMDDRQDQLLDVVIGENFKNLNSTSKITVTAGKKMQSVDGCLKEDKMTKLPKAQEHTAYNRGN